MENVGENCPGGCNDSHAVIVPPWLTRTHTRTYRATFSTGYILGLSAQPGELEITRKSTFVQK